MPRPDLVLVLQAPPEVITARKAQLPEPELVRQMAAWHQILPSTQRRLYLDTSASIRELLEQVSGAIPERAVVPSVAQYQQDQQRHKPRDQ